jgi:hypothetical protein
MEAGREEGTRKKKTDSHGTRMSLRSRPAACTWKCAYFASAAVYVDPGGCAAAALLLLRLSR